MARKGWSLDTSGYLPPRQGAYYHETTTPACQAIAW